MENSIRKLIILGFSYLLLIVIVPSFSIASSSLLQGQQLKHDDVLLSDSGSFQLGFLTVDDGNSFYLAIWYILENQTSIHKPNPVWVANRNTPIFDGSGILMISGDGSLEIKYGKGNSSTLPLHTVENATKTTATLRDDGNFVLLENESSTNGGGILWQSFDSPTDALMPGMKLGFNRRTGQNWNLTSWKSNNLPAMGSFTLGIDPHNTRQLIIWWRGSVIWTSGEWQEKEGSFILSPSLTGSYEGNYNQGDYYNQESSAEYNFHYNSSEDEVYFVYSINKNRLFLGPNLQVPRLTLTSAGEVDKGIGESAVSFCLFFYDFYSDSEYPECKSERLPECRSFDTQYFYGSRGFMSAEGFKFKESENLTVHDCQAICWKNCTCIAYASTNNLYDTGCEIWSSNATFNKTDDSVDGKGRQIYILREYHQFGGTQEERRWWISLVVLGALIATPILCYLCYIIWTKCKKEVDKIVKQTMLIREIGGRTVASIIYDITKRRRKDENTNDEIHIFSFKRIASVTKNFSAENKLGEGGFGPVYKGKMNDGQEIAIKRLSKRSGQGLVEFKNEAKLIAKLQHTNLVRLLGFCVQKSERMLIYEYMPNKSLDFYIFDPEKRTILNWTKRFSIIEGIAQGLVYLHIYSRLTLIHRDLKASNILLDNDMNPKISDFGMARIFELKGIEENTSRIVGTYGYMSPEYAMNGIVSIKTDVFSFGVLLLEIVSGKKNNSRYHSEYSLNLIGLTWQLWNEGRGTEIIDSSLLESCPIEEVLKCIQIGLLCVQDRASDRPSLLEIVSMLSNETTLLPSPKQPAFYFDTVEEEEPNGLEEQKTCSINEVTISVMDGRS